MCIHGCMGAHVHVPCRLAVGALPCPSVSREEVANACGLEDSHDGVNYMRAACVIAMAKAHELLEPFVHQVCTCSTVQCHLYCITVHALKLRGAAYTYTYTYTCYLHTRPCRDKVFGEHHTYVTYTMHGTYMTVPSRSRFAFPRAAWTAPFTCAAPPAWHGHVFAGQRACCTAGGW